MGEKEGGYYNKASLVQKKKAQTFQAKLFDKFNVIAWTDTNFTVCSLCLPPSAMDIVDFEYFVLFKRDFIFIVWTLLVVVQSPSSVWEFINCDVRAPCSDVRTQPVVIWRVEGCGFKGITLTHVFQSVQRCRRHVSLIVPARVFELVILRARVLIMRDWSGIVEWAYRGPFWSSQREGIDPLVDWRCVIRPIVEHPDQVNHRQ